jgi:hypothetical protein
MLYQKSLAELERRAYENMSELEKYTPTKEEKAQGKWAAVVERLDEDGRPDLESPCHIIPLFGREHYLSDRCWCEPAKKDHGDEFEYWDHKASQ